MVIDNNTINSLLTATYPIWYEFLKTERGVTGVTMKPTVNSPLYLKDNFGNPQELHISFDRGVGSPILKSGQFDYQHVSNVIDIIKKHRRLTLIDVGANIGLFTRQLLSSQKTKFSNAICFEPHPKNYELLVKNLGFLDTVDLRNYGLAAECREQTLYLDAQNSGNYSFLEEAMEGAICDSMTVHTKATETVFNDIINTNKNKFVYKSDTQGLDQKIACDIPILFWDRVVCATMELWRLPNNKYDEEKFESVLEKFDNAAFGKKFTRPVSSGEVIDYLRMDDRSYDDLYLW